MVNAKLKRRSWTLSCQGWFQALAQAPGEASCGCGNGSRVGATELLLHSLISKYGALLPLGTAKRGCRCHCCTCSGDSALPAVQRLILPDPAVCGAISNCLLASVCWQVLLDRLDQVCASAEGRHPAHALSLETCCAMQPY